MLFYVILFLLFIAAMALLTLPQLQGYRSLIWHYGVLVVGGMVPLLDQQVQFLQTFDWTQLIQNKQELAMIMLLIGLAGIILRYITKTAVGVKT